jgi:ParB-like chromosome segregation protein Spo0J
MSSSTSVPLGSISDDRCFGYRDPVERWPGTPRLKESIRRLGVLTPVLLRPPARSPSPSGRLQLVAGFRRVDLLRQLGRGEDHEVPARLVHGPPFELLLRSVEEHAGQEANLGERARAIRAGLGLLTGEGVPEEDAISAVTLRLLPPLGLQPHRDLVAQHLELLAAPQGLLELLVDKAFSLRRCLPLIRIERADAALLARVARHLQLGGRQIEEVATQLLEVARREQLELAQVVEELDLLEPHDPGRRGRQSAGALERLETRRMPETSRRRRELDRLCESFAGGGIDLRYDRDLCDDIVEIVLRCRSCEELRQQVGLLGQPGLSTRLEALLELLRPAEPSSSKGRIRCGTRSES